MYMAGYHSAVLCCGLLAHVHHCVSNPRVMPPVTYLYMYMAEHHSAVLCYGLFASSRPPPRVQSTCDALGTNPPCFSIIIKFLIKLTRGRRILETCSIIAS